MKKPTDEAISPVEQDPGSPVSDSANNGHGINSKSRNARAQARHRAKRKAYIEQLEENVTQLQAAMNARSSEGMGPGTSSARLIELEQENLRLRQEINHLRGQLAELLPLSPTQTPVMNGPNDEYGSRDSKRRKRSMDEPFSASASVS
ncbi:hypothetical protein BS47DRAFT_1341419 [Hydnum rufescens UP504]|uniref:BZIP domain-containing protein n=1 Tax=Hydnum rufescens UP504 TaxID=1448309 RepID=A0A9P6B347_9AGAM|nr:hypothetical protein BS47DRAFT_1341419 [Hydnum rufescens UP504]